METKKQVLEETGCDIYYADLFIEAAKQGAAEKDGYLPQYIIDDFYYQVEQHRKNREKRVNY